MKVSVGYLYSLWKLLLLVGFRLTKWISNDWRVLEAILVEERSKGVKNLDLDLGSLPVQRALGIHWTETDQYGIQIKSNQREFTRRGLLSIVITQAEQPGFKFRLSFFLCFFSALSHKSPSGLYSACITNECVRHMEFTEVVVVHSYELRCHDF